MYIPVIAEVLSIGKTWIDGRNKVKAAEAEAKATIITKAAEQDGKWEEIMAKGSLTSWKDEYWTIVLSIPLFMAFIPEFAPYVKQGFEVLKESVPEWYIWSLFGAIGAAFGLRGITRLAGK